MNKNCPEILQLRRDIEKSVQRNINTPTDFEFLSGVILRYLGKYKFVIYYVENSKLSEGDTFICQFFIAGQPLYIDNLIHNNGMPTAYVIGKRDGITSIEKKK